MRAVLTLCVCVCAVACQNTSNSTALPKYDSRYDYLDVDAVFANKRLIRNYVDCLISASRCTPEGKALKRLLPEALRTKCVRCTERQKRTAVKIIRRLKNEYPDEWAKLSVRWDPTGDFTRYFEDFLAKEMFNTIAGSDPVISLSTGTETQPPTPTPAATPAPLTSPPATTTGSTPPRPVIVNRFGGDGELMVSSPSLTTGTSRPTMAPATIKISTMRPTIQPRPIQTTVSPQPPGFTLRPTSELPYPYTTAITIIIDQIGYKIIRTTELVTDLLRNTVRAVVGYHIGDR